VRQQPGALHTGPTDRLFRLASAVPHAFGGHDDAAGVGPLVHEMPRELIVEAAKRGDRPGESELERGQHAGLSRPVLSMD